MSSRASSIRFFGHHRSRRRVVLTGMGIVSPLGSNTQTCWTNLLAGKCAISKLNKTEAYEKLPCHVAASIPKEIFDPESKFSKSELRTMSRATTFAMTATAEALKQSRWRPSDDTGKQRTGVAIGMGMVDLEDVCNTHEGLKKGYNKVSPFFVPRILLNMAAGQISIKYGFQGPNHSVSTACATGAHAIGDAFRFIREGDADVMICGGAEAPINPLAVAGFCRLRALSSNEDPLTASRPFDRKRDGFVMGEGAAILVLEELEHAKCREAEILGEILGYGLSGDASHLTAPREDGIGAVLVMSRTLSDAGIKAVDVGYVNAHATSTPVGDIIEARAIKTIFKGDKKPAVSSTKGSHGHLLGSAGNLEAAFTILACKEGKLPPTLNFERTEDEIQELNFVPNKTQNWETTDSRRRIGLSNSFGFGGTNACICVGSFEE